MKFLTEKISFKKNKNPVRTPVCRLGPVFFIFLFSACGSSDPIAIDVLRKPEPVPSSRVWNSPRAIDLGELGGNYLQFNSDDMSFGDFRFTFNAQAAILSSSFYSGSKYRVYNRVYWGDGTGWSGSGAGYSIVDNGGQDSRNLAASLSPSGVFLGVMTDGATTQSIASTAPGAGWMFFNSNVGVAPVATHATSTGVTQGGYSTDVAWDSTNSAYYGFLSAGANPRATVLRYLGFAGWDASALKVELPGRASQVRMLSEGNGATVLWRGDEILRSTALAVGGSGAVDEFVCTVGKSGDLRCWGEGTSGQLGNDASSDLGQPTSSAASSNSSIALAISAGTAHVCAIVDNGAVRCWGENGNGQLGIGASTDLDTAAGVNASLSSTATALAVAAGGDFSCAILNDSNHTVKCWGNNANGQLGHAAPPCAAANCGDAVGEMGDYTDATDSGLPPVGEIDGDAVTSAMSSAIAITAGSAHACALISGGTVKCWGVGTSGELGDGGGATSSAPVSVTGVTTATQIASGSSHTCAVLLSGAMKCWGENGDGQLGDNNAPNDGTTPVSVAGLSGATQAAAGTQHTCALINDGTVKCWGDNSKGQIGDGTTTNRATPTAVTGLAERVVEISARGDRTCARLFSGEVQCWGNNDNSLIGNPDAPDPAPTPYTVVVKCPLGDGKCALNAARTASNGFSSAFGEARTASTASSFSYSAQVRTFGADSDQLGTLVTAFVQDKTNYSFSSSSSCATAGFEKCAGRLYAVTRTSGGDWTEPMQLDAHANDGLTTYYQNAAQAGGVDYATPAVAHVGNGRFVVVYALTESINSTTAKTSLYLRGFTAGQGWDASSVWLDSFWVAGTPFYRAINELKVTGDGAGSVLVMAQVVDPGTAYGLPSLRKYVYRNYVYDSKTSQWDGGQWIPDLPGCAVTQANCASPRMDGAIFSGGRAVFVFPGADSGLPTRVRLYSSEYVR